MYVFAVAVPLRAAQHCQSLVHVYALIKLYQKFSRGKLSIRPVVASEQESVRTRVFHHTFSCVLTGFTKSIRVWKNGVTFVRK